MRPSRLLRTLLILIVPVVTFMVLFLQIYTKQQNKGSDRDPPSPVWRHPAAVPWLRHDTTEDRLSSFVASDRLVTDMETTEHSWPWGKVKGCEEKTYDVSGYPDVSVIITFYDVETIYHLLHTVHAVIQNTPASLLREIILVDDATSKDDLKYVLPNYLKMAFKGKVVLIKSQANVGLIKARNLGFRVARGQVVAVMDSHMEPRPHWLEALLVHIVEDKRTIAVSFLDWMEKKSDGSWLYKHGPSTWKTYFDWELTFGFMDLPEREKKARLNDGSAPIRTPTMIGGIYAIRKDFLEEIGYYDDGLEGWGGENVEMTMKAWLCGGRVLNVPCSHVAHLEPGNRGYRSGADWQDKIKRNYKRVSQMFGPHEKYINHFRPNIRNIRPQNMTANMNILKKCPRDTTWFFREVFPEIGIPDQNTLAQGGVKNVGNQLCLDTVFSFAPKLVKCDPLNPSHQGFFLTTDGRIRIPVHYLITQSNAVDSKVTLANCISADLSAVNTWYHWKGGPLIDVKSGLCLNAKTDQLSLSVCDPTSNAQKWQFKEYSADYTRYVTQFSPSTSPAWSALRHDVQQYLINLNSAKVKYDQLPSKQTQGATSKRSQTQR